MLMGVEELADANKVTMGPKMLNCVTVAAELVTCSWIVPMKYRNDKISILDYGAVGDGQTVNTKALREAIYMIEHLKRPGGTLLYIPPGEYLTEAFHLTSHMTLYLARGACIKVVKGVLVLKDFNIADNALGVGKGMYKGN